MIESSRGPLGDGTARRAVTAAAGALLFASVLAGCGDQQEVLGSDPSTADAQVGSMLLRNLYVNEPSGDAYEAGADATTFLTLVNQAPRPDTLVDVTTPVARTVEIRWDRDCDGTAELLPVLPLPAQVDLTSPPNAPGPTEADYFLRLVDLDRRVLSGTSIPVTFTFANAGTLRVDVPVDDAGLRRSEPPRSCRPAPSTPAASGG